MPICRKLGRVFEVSRPLHVPHRTEQQPLYIRVRQSSERIEQRAMGRHIAEERLSERIVGDVFGLVHQRRIGALEHPHCARITTGS
jgi:hypothetical protein